MTSSTGTMWMALATHADAEKQNIRAQRQRPPHGRVAVGSPSQEALTRNRPPAT
jgi:hypothetical protein